MKESDKTYVTSVYGRDGSADDLLRIVARKYRRLGLSYQDNVPLSEHVGASLNFRTRGVRIDLFGSRDRYKVGMNNAQVDQHIDTVTELLESAGYDVTHSGVDGVWKSVLRQFTRRGGKL